MLKLIGANARVGVLFSRYIRTVPRQAAIVRITALPSDVRKASGFPKLISLFVREAMPRRRVGHSPGVIKSYRKGGAFPHIRRQSRSAMISNKFIRINLEIESALASNKPVVALESTVIAHGLPRPANIETAERLEEIVREAGAIPTTIAVLDGQFFVGLDREQLGRIGNSNDIEKLSARDLPIAVARKWNGATTVAATMWIAHRARIEVFATGGIGGVHRGPLPDVSADLPELARTPMIAVCSGAKIVLDLPATREWLETYSVTIIGYGCDEMPAFYSRLSGLPVDVRCDSP